MEDHAKNRFVRKSAPYRESDSYDERPRKGRLVGINRFGEENITADSYQDDQFENDYDPTYKDQYGHRHPYLHGGVRNRWSDDIRSEASHENHFGKGPKGYYRTDQKIYEDVCEKLTKDPNLDASELEVSVRNKCVYLDGFVKNREQKRYAEEIVDAVSGIEDVMNKIKIYDIKYESNVSPIKEIL